MQAESLHQGWMFWFYENKLHLKKYIRNGLRHEMESFSKKFYDLRWNF